MIRGGLVTLVVHDVGRAVRFYVETLGMKLVEEAGAGWAVIDAGDGFRIALHEGGTAEARSASSPSVGLYAKVPLREAIAIYENRGVTFDLEDDGPVTLARFRDPDGNLLHLRQER